MFLGGKNTKSDVTCTSRGSIYRHEQAERPLVGLSAVKGDNGHVATL